MDTALGADALYRIEWHGLPGSTRARWCPLKGYEVTAWGRDPSWTELEPPRPGPGEVLVRVRACGVGLTVLNCINGDLADGRATLPRVPGHEYVGEVTGTGPGVDPGLAGRLVAAYFYLSCGWCPECVAGQEPRCRNLAGHVGVHRDGGYAQYATLPVHLAIPLPGDLDPVAATVVPDAVATPVHVCRRAQMGPFDRVAVLGAGGGVGIHLLQVARLHGAAVAGLEVAPGKLGRIEELGATPVDAGDLDGLDPALWPDGPPTVVVDLVGRPATLRWGAAALAPGGRLVVLTTFRDVLTELDPRALVGREAAVLGSRYATRREVQLAAELVAARRVTPVIGRTCQPEDVLSLHDELRAGRLLGRGALAW